MARTQSSSRRYQLLIGIAFILASVAVGFMLLKWIIQLSTGIPTEIGAVIITVAGTAVASTLTLAVSRVYEKRKDIERDLRDKKINVYSNSIKFIFRTFFFSAKSGEKVDDAKASEFLQDFTTDMIMWGSDQVVSDWTNFQKGIRELGDKSERKENHRSLFIDSAIRPFGRLLLAIRADVGHKNKGLSDLTISDMYITDLDKYLHEQGKSE